MLKVKFSCKTTNLKTKKNKNKKVTENKLNSDANEMISFIAIFVSSYYAIYTFLPSICGILPEILRHVATLYLAQAFAAFIWRQNWVSYVN